MTVAVVTDSGAGLSAPTAAAHGVTLVPIWIHLDGREARDGEIGLSEVLAAPEVSTSGPSPGEFEQAIAAVLADHAEVLVVTVAASLSSTNSAARLGAGGFGPRVRVLDSATAAGGQALVALAAARAAAEGAALATVETRAREAMERVRLVASLATYDYLVRSGRVPGVAAWAANRLSVRPMFELRGGAPRAVRPVRGANDVERLVTACAAEQEAGARLHAIAMHAGAPERAELLAAAVRARVQPAMLLVEPFGAAMVAHTGPGLLGLAWWWQPA
ncbi:MAG TPA: DegV family protein [Acidimicrobiales bacterium]|nr:DegV family protein [Acidimicrobiales bacterium]